MKRQLDNESDLGTQNQALSLNQRDRQGYFKTVKFLKKFNANR